LRIVAAHCWRRSQQEEEDSLVESQNRTGTRVFPNFMLFFAIIADFEPSIDLQKIITKPAAQFIFSHSLVLGF